MHLVKRNAEIGALLRAGNLSRRQIALRYGLHFSTISLIALKHGNILGPQTRRRCGSRASWSIAGCLDARCPNRRLQPANLASHFGRRGALCALPPNPTLDRRRGACLAPRLWQTRTFREQYRRTAWPHANPGHV